MKHYKFNFKYISARTRISGDGTCQGEDARAATASVRVELAKDLGCSPDNVIIESLREFKPRKKKAVKP